MGGTCSCIVESQPVILGGEGVYVVLGAGEAKFCRVELPQSTPAAVAAGPAADILVTARVDRGYLVGVYVALDEQLPAIKRKVWAQEKYCSCSDDNCDHCYPNCSNRDGLPCSTCMLHDGGYVRLSHQLSLGGSAAADIDNKGLMVVKDHKDYYFAIRMAAVDIDRKGGPHFVTSLSRDGSLGGAATGGAAVRVSVRLAPPVIKITTLLVKEKNDRGDEKRDGGMFGGGVSGFLNAVITIRNHHGGNLSLSDRREWSSSGDSGAWEQWRLEPSTTNLGTFFIRSVAHSFGLGAYDDKKTLVATGNKGQWEEFKLVPSGGQFLIQSVPFGTYVSQTYNGIISQSTERGDNEHWQLNILSIAAPQHDGDTSQQPTGTPAASTFSAPTPAVITNIISSSTPAPAPNSSGVTITKTTVGSSMIIGGTPIATGTAILPPQSSSPANNGIVDAAPTESKAATVTISKADYKMPVDDANIEI